MHLHAASEDSDETGLGHPQSDQSSLGTQVILLICVALASIIISCEAYCLFELHDIEKSTDREAEG